MYLLMMFYAQVFLVNHLAWLENDKALKMKNSGVIFLIIFVAFLRYIAQSMYY